MGHKANVTWVDESFEDIKELFGRDSRWQLVPNFKSKYTSSTNRSESWENCQNAANERKQWDHGWELHNPDLLAASPSPRCTLTSQGITHFPRNLDSAGIRHCPATVRGTLQKFWSSFSRKVSRRGTFPPSPDQVSLRLFELPCDFSEEICVNVGRGRGKLKGLFQDFPTGCASRVLGRTFPGHTFAFRQDTAAQAEQRGESEPRPEAGRHRVLEAPGEAPSFHGNDPVFRFTQTLEKGVIFFISAVKESFSWPGKLWQLLLLALIYNSELAQREDTHSWTLWRHGEGGQMRRRLLRYTVVRASISTFLLI